MILLELVQKGHRFKFCTYFLILTYFSNSLILRIQYSAISLLFCSVRAATLWEAAVGLTCIVLIRYSSIIIVIMVNATASSQINRRSDSL